MMTSPLKGAASRASAGNAARPSTTHAINLQAMPQAYHGSVRFPPIADIGCRLSGSRSIPGSCGTLSIGSAMERLAQSFDLCSRVNPAIGHDLLDDPEALLDLAALRCILSG